MTLFIDNIYASALNQWDILPKAKTHQEIPGEFCQHATKMPGYISRKQRLM